VNPHEETPAQVVTKLSTVEDVAVLLYEPAGHSVHETGTVIAGKAENKFAQMDGRRRKTINHPTEWLPNARTNCATSDGRRVAPYDAVMFGSKPEPLPEAYTFTKPAAIAASVREIPPTAMNPMTRLVANTVSIISNSW